MTRFAAVVAALVSIGAGFYLISVQAAAQNSILEVLAHGIGAYFIAKGLFMGVTLWRLDDSHASVTGHLQSLGELLARRLPRRDEDTGEIIPVGSGFGDREAP